MTYLVLSSVMKKSKGKGKKREKGEDEIPSVEKPSQPLFNLRRLGNFWL